MSNGLDADQDRRSIVGPDLGPNYLQIACCVIFLAFVVVYWLFFKINFFQTIFSGSLLEGPDSGLDPTRDRRSVYKQFAKVIGRRQKSPLARKE